MRATWAQILGGAPSLTARNVSETLKVSRVKIDASHERPAAPAAPELDLLGYARLLLAKRWLVVGCMLLAGALAFLFTFRQARTYEATSTIEYDPYPVRPLGRDVEDVADPVGNYWRTQEFFQTQNQILKSRALAERVVLRLGLHENAGFNHYAGAGRFPGVSSEQAARRLQERITVLPIQNTRVVRVSVRDSDPERAQLIVNTLVDSYIEKTVEDRLGSTVNALDWLGTQLEALRTELNDAELALHEFKEEHNVLSVSLEDQRNLVAQEIQHFNDALTEVRSRRIALQARMEVLNGATREDPLAVHAPVASADGALLALRSRIHEAEQERASLAVRYGDQHPELARASAELATLRGQYRDELARVIDTAAAELAEARNTEAGLRAALGQANEAGLALNLREIEYARLQRERQNKVQVYELVLQRATEADLTRMLQTTYVRIVDRALRPTSPISPSFRNNTGAGLAIGALLGIAIAILLHRLDRRIRTLPELEAFGIPVLGMLPTFPETDDGRRAVRARRRKSPALSTHSPDRDLIVHRQPNSVAAECCRSIRTNLTFMAVDAPLKSLLVTSGVPEEGKTTVLVSLAISLAQSGKRVLVVDTDLRRPQLHRSFDVDPTVGLTSVLAGEATLARAVVATQVPGLSLLPAGPIPPNPAELLQSRPFAAIVEEVQASYDLALFDAPPANVVTDAAVLASQLGATAVVVRAGSTTRDSLLSTLRHLGDVSAHVVGAVFNHVDLGARGAYAVEYARYGYGAYAADAAAEQPNAAE